MDCKSSCAIRHLPIYTYGGGCGGKLFLKVAVWADLTVCFVVPETSEGHSLCTHNYLPIF